MSKITRRKADKILAAWNNAKNESEKRKVTEFIENLSWDDLHALQSAWDRENTQRDPYLLTLLVNIETPEDLTGFREEFPGATRDETNDSIFQLRDELIAVWGKSEEETGPAIRKWFEQVPIDLNQDRWHVIYELGIIRPLYNLPGSVARALLAWHEYCETCKNPDCHGAQFVADRKTQKYCLLTEECRKYGHRAAARNHYQRRVSKNRKVA